MEFRRKIFFTSCHNLGASMLLDGRFFPVSLVKFSLLCLFCKGNKFPGFIWRVLKWKNRTDGRGKVVGHWTR